MRRSWIVALAGLVVVLAFGSRLLWPEDDVGPTAAPEARVSGSAGDLYPILIPAGDEVTAGHVRFRLMSARLDRHESAPDGTPTMLALHVNLQATELESRDTRLAGGEIQLLAGGRPYSPRTAASAPLWASQSVELDELVFLVPAPLATASLQFSTPDGGSALLPLRLPR